MTCSRESLRSAKIVARALNPWAAPLLFCLALVLGSPAFGQTSPSAIDTQENVSPNARERYQRGVAAARRRALRDALTELDYAIDIDPEYAHAHNARGVVLAMMNRSDEAEAAFRAAIRLKTDFFEPHFNLGKLLLEARRPSEAQRELTKAAELDPGHLPTAELLFDSLLATHEEKSAAALLKRIHERRLEHPAQLHLELATAMTEHGSREMAIEQYRLVFVDDPSPSERRDAELSLSRLGAHR